MRFDNVQPNGGTITLEWTGRGGGAAVIAGVQLVLNAPDVGNPPEIVDAPQPGVGIEGGTLTLTAGVNGDNLVYQWRKDGKNVVDGGNISGATTDTLTIRRMSADDEGIYTLAVFNQAGSIISRRTTVRLSEFEVEEGLVAYFPMDETSGMTAANAVDGGQPGELSGAPTWQAGRIGNALNLQGENEDFVYISDYTKGQAELSASLWVNVDDDILDTFDVPMFFRNADGIDLNAANPAEQFELGLLFNNDTFEMNLSAAITSGPNVTRFTQQAAFPLGEWVHVAFSVDGAQLRLYLNGTRIGTVDYVGTINPPDIDWLAMGARLTDNEGVIEPDFGNQFPDFMHGLFDDVALWTRGITETEVTKIYEAGLAGNPLTSVVLDKPSVDPGELPGDPEIALDGVNITITWEGGVLQSATNPAGPYTEVAQESPHTEAADGEKYFRTQGTE